MVSGRVGGVGGVEWGLQCHFHVQPNFCVEVMLCYVVVGVVTKKLVILCVLDIYIIFVFV